MRVSVAVLCLAICVSASAQNPPDQSATRDKILALENAWNQAEEHKDAKALNSILASTLVYVDYDGTLMNKVEFMASVKRPSLHPLQIVNELMTTWIYRDTIVVTGIYRETGALEGKPYARRGRFTDTWVNFDGTWECVASQSTLIER
jgi:hypothetical protein